MKIAITILIIDNNNNNHNTTFMSDVYIDHGDLDGDTYMKTPLIIITCFLNKIKIKHCILLKKTKLQLDSEVVFPNKQVCNQ